jgi:D-alanyl-D-alanine endopeptidase (penicillin-binding protein 7)
MTLSALRFSSLAALALFATATAAIAAPAGSHSASNASKATAASTANANQRSLAIPSAPKSADQKSVPPKVASRTKPSSSAPKADIPEVRSNAALVLDSGDGTILYARNANKAMPIASITKLMTSLIVLEQGLPMDEQIVMTREDRDRTRGAASRLAVGAKLTRGDLMHLALMASDNRAAHALGRTYPGGADAAVKAMNLKAQSLGMTDSRFADLSGLSSQNVASARDVAKLVQAVSKFDSIREYSTDQDHSVVVLKQATRFRNTNYLVAKPDWLIDVQKTGFTNDAGQCLAMKAAIQGRSVVIVLLDSFGKHTRTADARRIRKWLEARPATRVVQASM